MTIKHAMLGLLSWQPLSGYDLKKIMSESNVFYWSGNNNQIYKALIEMHKQGLVSLEVQTNDLPARKVYSITSKGEEELREWVLSHPELPELHNTFLIQLAWAGQLVTKDELILLMGEYERQVEIELASQQEKVRRRLNRPDRSRRETWLWDIIADNVISKIKNELDWIRRARNELGEASLD
jgi:PadR family transcriptional regulator, regulatory protein AphA